MDINIERYLLPRYKYKNQAEKTKTLNVLSSMHLFKRYYSKLLKSICAIKNFPFLSLSQ